METDGYRYTWPREVNISVQHHQHQGRGHAAGTATAGGGYAISNSSRISYDGSTATAARSLAELSAMSVGSSIGGVSSSKAKVPAQGILRLHILRAESLPHVHLSSTTGPYLAVRHDNMRHKTRIQNAGGVHPTWDECFDLYVNSADARRQSVLFTVKNKKKASSSGNGGGGGGGSGAGNSADGDSRSIISTITGGGSSVLGVANVKLVSLCAKERTLLIPLRQVGSRPKQAAGCLKVRVSFEAWNNNARRTGVGSVGAVTGTATATAAAGDPSPMNLATNQHRLQNQAKQQLMAMPQQSPQQPPATSMHRRSSPRQMMMGVDQRVEYGGHGPPPSIPPQLPRSAGLPPRGPSSLILGRGTGGGYHRLREDSLEDAGADMELVGATAPAYHHRSAAKTTTNRPHRGGDNRQRPSSRNHHRRGGGGRRGDHRRSGRERRRDHDMEERDDNTPRREDVPSMVDVVYEEVDDDHSAIDLTVDSEGGSMDYDHPRWGRARHSPASFQPHARDVIVSTSKFLCF